MLGLLGLAATTISAPVATGAFALIGVWALLPKRDKKRTRKGREPSESVERSSNKVVKELQKAVVQAIKTSKNPTEVSLNFEAMRAMYDVHGTRGLYAYLVSNEIAKDAQHGDFIINDIFLPELTRRLKQEEEEAKEKEIKKSTRIKQI